VVIDVHMRLGTMLGTTSPHEILHGLDGHGLRFGANHGTHLPDDAGVSGLDHEHVLGGGSLLVPLGVDPTLEINNPSHPSQLRWCDHPMFPSLLVMTPRSARKRASRAICSAA